MNDINVPSSNDDWPKWKIYVTKRLEEDRETARDDKREVLALIRDLRDELSRIQIADLKELRDETTRLKASSRLVAALTGGGVAALVAGVIQWLAK